VIDVSCAILEGIDGAILAAQRNNEGRFAGKWEFPGGKVEPGETPEKSIHREMLEEMGVGITIRDTLPSVRHDYGFLVVELHPFIARITSGAITLHEHQAIRWDDPANLLSLDWAEADIPVIRMYIALRTPFGGSRE
jgi:8-oxo-dGTP diphosphatase